MQKVKNQKHFHKLHGDFKQICADYYTDNEIILTYLSIFFQSLNLSNGIHQSQNQEECHAIGINLLSFVLLRPCDVYSYYTSQQSHDHYLPYKNHYFCQKKPSSSYIFTSSCGTNHSRINSNNLDPIFAGLSHIPLVFDT